jgi:hypothetical protein
MSVVEPVDKFSQIYGRKSTAPRMKVAAGIIGGFVVLRMFRYIMGVVWGAIPIIPKFGEASMSPLDIIGHFVVPLGGFVALFVIGWLGAAGLEHRPSNSSIAAVYAVGAAPLLVLSLLKTLGMGALVMTTTPPDGTYFGAGEAAAAVGGLPLLIGVSVLEVIAVLVSVFLWSRNPQRVYNLSADRSVIVAVVAGLPLAAFLVATPF